MRAAAVGAGPGVRPRGDKWRPRGGGGRGENKGPCGAAAHRAVPLAARLCAPLLCVRRALPRGPAERRCGVAELRAAERCGARVSQLLVFNGRCS